MDLPLPNTTSWKTIREAADGLPEARARFASRHAPRIREALHVRWRGRPIEALVDDALQEVFVECFKEDGLLRRADPNTGPGFRAYLAGLVRNIALRFEEREARERYRRERHARALHGKAQPLTSVSRVLDREWARAIVLAAAAEQERRAAEVGAKALLRVEILRLRFRDNLPIREIAARWGISPRYAHRQYEKARHDFRRALFTVLRRRAPEASDDVLTVQCRQLMDLLE